MSAFQNVECNVLSIGYQQFSAAKIFPNLVVLNVAVVCRRVFTWVVLLLILVLLRV